ncbi:bifunctional tetrahydrofolate synthase/dihydrofolate synthase [Alteromonas aestuariivivens]|uniref:Dihydrofolate synthase/folylpolyglutamate synthase n=1 Tax=Alteromonas aestuariivivens TaxID=1938339 RepID=A0A3D8M438_9ALTE|nr:bifunctional tetrahydrofolate synthase/dihydrofolate synthase [Alteromonas aestuariivivens]RDV24294.1 bifunctional tetrahydrofolate synthase/dihydrofolate synthase [Alteromonas aestuariivivens]
MNNPPSNNIAPEHRTLAQWLSYLESIHPTAIDMGLERVSDVARRIALNFENATVITVGGTNGKGTTCRILEQTLLAQGKSVGVYSSPHLMDYRERVRINDQLRPEQEYCDAFQQVEAARGEISLTYFEFGTLAAMLMLQAARLDVIILEVGLGGRLDATNIVDADLAILTTIGLDHQDWLGDTREQIAQEKAGILRKGIPAVVGEPDPPSNLAAIIAGYGALPSWAGKNFGYEQQGDTWSWFGSNARFSGLVMPKVPMQNVSTALAALEQLECLPECDVLNAVLEHATLPGRRQQIQDHPTVIVDVAHNPQATEEMARWLDNCCFDNLYIVVGMLKDKAIAETLASLANYRAHWYLASTDGPRGCDASSLLSALPAGTVESSHSFPKVVEAYRGALEKAQQNDLILVFGSFLTVADVLAFHTDRSTCKE